MSEQRRNADSKTRVGQSLAGGKYIIEALLGRGGMGSLYRARHTVLDRLVAIKLLHPDLTEDPTAEARFLLEAKAASRLDHPSSIQVLDFGSEQGTCYIVMELLEGRDLASVVEAEGHLAPARAVSIMSQVLAAVGAAHDVGIIHRDLKPENIMVLRQRDGDETQERVKVLDFGIAKIGSSEGSVSRALTAVGEICGTPEYMSPEQARGLTLDPRSDLYSCGVVLYRILTLKLPFRGETPVGTLMQHITEPVPRPSILRPDLPPLLEEAILKAMAKSPDERFPDARAMRVALAHAVGDERISLLPEASSMGQNLRTSTPSLSHFAHAPTMAMSQPKPSSWGWMFVVTAIVVVVGAAAAVLWMKMPQTLKDATTVRATLEEASTAIKTPEVGGDTPSETLRHQSTTDLVTTDPAPLEPVATSGKEPSLEKAAGAPGATVAEEKDSKDNKAKRTKRNRSKSKRHKDKSTNEAAETPSGTDPEPSHPEKTSDEPIPAPSEAAPAPSVEEPAPN
ncbi:MAG: serine/threonine protein kinase [Myxococcota bacterium]|jgi:serine/threonine-protein kinase|nr:serine/threonine protein kinase [Myxococcota bacterium]